MSAPMRLGWFLNFMPPAWRGIWRAPERRTWLDGAFYVDIARQLDRAGIDFMLLEDSSMVPDTYGGDMRAELGYTSRAPKGDPVALLPLLAQATRSIGFAVTMSTSLYSSRQVAAVVAAEQAIAPGRVAWNVVTSAEDRAAQNLGHDALAAHQDRYRLAGEHVERVLADWESPAFAAATGGARRPVIVQAGSSEPGRDLAARYGEIVLASQKGTERMRAFRDDIRARAEAFGRDPDTRAVMFLVSPVIGETSEEARARAERIYAPTYENVERRLVHMSSGDIDFSRLDWDAPIPESLTTNGLKSSLENLRRAAAGRTLREIAASRVESVPLVGTPDEVADRMAELSTEVGGDGFLFFGGGGGLLTRRYVAEITEGLVPALADRGLLRESTPAGLRERMSGSPESAHPLRSRA